MSVPRQGFGDRVATAFSAWFFQAYRRPLLFLLFIVILPLVLVIGFTHQINVTMARAQALNNLHMTARLAAEAIDKTLNDARLFEQLLAAQPAFLEAVEHRDQERLAALLQQALPLLPEADEALVSTTDGQILAASPVRSDLLGRSLAQDEGFQGAQVGGWHAYVSAIHLRDDASLEKVVDVVLPIVRETQVLGVLKVEYQVGAVKSWIHHIRVDPDGFLYVVDHHDQLVIYPFQVLPGKPKIVSNWPPVTQLLTPEGAVLTFQDARFGRRWFAGVFPVGETGWRVIAVQPEEAVFQLLHRVLWPMGILVFILLAMVVVISLRWARLQALNLRLLQQNAKLLKQSQQRWTLEHGKPPRDPSEEEGAP